MRFHYRSSGIRTATEARTPAPGFREVTVRRQPLEIKSLGVALFEIQIDLDGHAGMTTRDIPEFSRKLLVELPTLREHKCWSGETGGFVEELDAGTDFAHVIEHVVLELQHLADPEGRTYSGWTKCSLSDEGTTHGVFTIHFQTPSFEIGSAAAHSAVRIVSNLIQGTKPGTREALDQLQELPW
jgi:cyanophycin synthetase